MAHPHRQIDLYFGLLTLTFGVAGQLALLPVQFYQKDQLHLGAQAVANFQFLVGIPTYVGFLFGYLRDRWRPPRWGDRAYLLGAALLSVAAYLLLAQGQITYARLLVMGIALSAFGQMIGTVIQAVSAAVAQRNRMTGQLSAVYWIGFNAPGVIAALGGGWLAAHLPARETFLLVAGVTGLVALQAFWRPRAVYDDLPDQPAVSHGGLHAVSRLIRHQPIWPAVLISGMWNFALCVGTPVLYYLTGHVHLNPEQFGIWGALMAGAFLPATALYGVVCRRFSLHRLLWAGTPLAVLQMLLFLFMHNLGEAYGAAIAAGLCGGFVNGAYWDLLMRSAPKGLEGTAMTLGFAASTISGAGSNVLGAYIYGHGGFALSVWLTTLVYALIFLVLLWVPRSITSMHDAGGDPTPVPASA